MALRIKRKAKKTNDPFKGISLSKRDIGLRHYASLADAVQQQGGTLVATARGGTRMEYPQQEYVEPRPVTRFSGRWDSSYHF